MLLFDQWLSQWNVPWFYLSLALVVGLLVGSFLNVVIYRLPKMMERGFRQECCEFLEQPQLNDTTGNKEAFNLAIPGSRCGSCNSAIKPWHNIPVLSYLLLKGRCASCNAGYSARYPIVEFITGILSLLMLLHFGLNTQGILALVFLWSLICLTMIDIDTQLLPDSITLPLLWCGLIANSFNVYVPLIDSLWGAAAGYLSLWSIYWLFKLITGKEGMGFGDFKLLAALGAWMGWQILPMIIILSSFVGAAIGIAGILILGRNKNIPIPFGPYLAIAGGLAFIWGEQLLAGYLAFFAL